MSLPVTNKKITIDNINVHMTDKWQLEPNTIHTIISGATMKTNKLPRSAAPDEQAVGSQPQPHDKSSTYNIARNKDQNSGCASNDSSYKVRSHENERKSKHDNVHAIKNELITDCYSQNIMDCEDSSKNKKVQKDNDDNSRDNNTVIESSYKKPKTTFKKSSTIAYETEASSYLLSGEESIRPSDCHTLSQSKALAQSKNIKESIKKPNQGYHHSATEHSLSVNHNNQIPERIFMNGLIKHTAIALAIIIPLAAFSAYAASPNIMPTNGMIKNTAAASTATLAVEPSDIIHNSESMPTAVDNVDLEQYAGTWYEIGRLPMYFQRNCASDVTATYTGKDDGSGITVLNECRKADGSGIVAEGIAKPVDSSGSKLKVSFLPSWLRWLPVGKADYWVLARDADYQTALVGTPNKKYLWLLARTPDISQQTYAKYRQIAQQQGYDLKEFKLTTQTNQNVTLIP